jgi:PAS domain S-box-containing protein
MNNLMLPSQISWRLAWSDLFSLFQSLHTSICTKDVLKQMIFGGQNTVICQNLQRVWQQVIDDFADGNGCISDTDLVPTEQVVTTQLSYSIASTSHSVANLSACELTCHQTYVPLPPQNVEASVFIVTSNFCLWMQVQPDFSTSWKGEDSIGKVPLHRRDDPEVSHRWQVTLVLAQQIIAQQIQDLNLTTIAPWLACADLSVEHWPSAVQQFWQHFLLTTQSCSLGKFAQGPLQTEQTLFTSVLQQMPIGMFQASLDGGILEVNTAFCQLTGYTPTQLTRLDLQAITQPEDFRLELEMIQQIVQHREQRIFEKRYCCLDSRVVWAEVKMLIVGDPEDDNSFLLGFVTDLSAQRQIEVERLQAIQEIQKRQDREVLLNNIVLRIRSVLDLPTMLQNAAQELNDALGTDRVVVYQIFPNHTGCCVSEAVNSGCTAMQGQTFSSDCMPPPHLEAYRTGRLWSVEDVSIADLSECHQQMLAQVEVKSMIATGILSMDDALEPNKRQLWGLLVVHQCSFTRQWTTDELHLVEAVANQLAIALEQTKLLNQLTVYTQELEDRVSQRTRSLERSLQFEQFIRSLTECLHREHNEDKLFQVVVKGLVSTLKVDACLVSLYNRQFNQFEVKFEAINHQLSSELTFLHQHFSLKGLSPELQNQFNDCQPHCVVGSSEMASLLMQLLLEENKQPLLYSASFSGALICPILGADQSMGLLLMLQSQPCQFDSAQIELIEQTANYCAIALRQTNLYYQEHEQRLSAEYLRSFLEKSTDVYVEYDPQLRYISINPAGCSLLGRPLEDIIGKTNHELLQTETHCLDQLIQQAFTTAEQVFVAHEVLLPDEQRTFESIYAPIADPSGTVQRVIGVCRDVTEFKNQWQLLERQNQQLAETTRIKQEFVATTSHELRTPLTAILGFSNVLLQEFWGELNIKQKNYIERIHESGQHLLELINDILDLSRLEAGRMELDLQTIYIADICEAVVGLIQERLVSQGLELEIDLAADVEWIVADPRRLKQMLLNLLANAVKFTPQGKVGLRVYCDRSDSNQLRGNSNQLLAEPSTHLAGVSTPNLPFIHFRVWDTGIGIAEADHRLLFSPFSQLDSSLARKHQGTGLGLVITQKLALLHGGYVTFNSKLGLGSTFTISLPIRASI